MGKAKAIGETLQDLLGGEKEMNKTTAKALEQSIKHWERMRDGKRRKSKNRDGLEIPNADDCALCGLFSDKGCNGCPIYLKTGKDCCFDTPYRLAANLFNREGIDSPEFKAAAQKMIDFLISLRDQP